MRIYSLLKSLFFYYSKELNENDLINKISILNNKEFRITKFLVLKRIISYIIDKNNKELFEKIINNLDQIVLSKKMTNKLFIKSINFKIKEDLNKETILILNFLKKINFRFDFKSSDFFYSFYLESKIFQYTNYREILNKLFSLNFKVNSNPYNKRLFLTKNFLSSMHSFDKYFFKIDLMDKLFRIQFLTVLFKLENPYKIKKWVSFFIKNYKEKLSIFEMFFLIRINNKINNYYQLKKVILSNLDNNLLRSLVEKNYNFLLTDQNRLDHLNLFDCLHLSKNINEFVKKIFEKDNKHLVFLIGKEVFKNKTIDFNLLKKLLILKDGDINLIYEALNNKDFVEKNYFKLDNQDLVIIKDICLKIKSNKKIKFINDLLKDSEKFNEFKTYYSQIVSIDKNFILKHNYNDFESFLSYIINKYKNSYFENGDLDQINHFPKLKKIDGLVIDNLRFEIPKTRYDLFVYGKKMGNCISTYSNKCEIKHSILIGVYKNEKIEYNIELGVDFSENITLVDIFNIDTKDFIKKRKIVQFQRRFKQLVDETDKIIIEKEIFDKIIN